MSDLTVAFIELIRRAQAGKRSSFYHHCDGCQTRAMFVLMTTTSTQELYGCANCGFTKAWKVR